MRPHAPWTDLGSLQQEIDGVANQLRGKVDKYEMVSLRTDLDRLAYTVEGLRTDLATFRAWLEELQTNQVKETP